MSSSLDMSLDDIIKNNKKPGSGNSSGRARGRGSGPGPARRPQNRAANRLAPYATAQAPEVAWQHDMYMDPGVGMGFPAQTARASAIETGTKLYVSNLDYGVSNEDIKELFTEVGDLKRYSVHYDRSGRSKGTAEVVFSRRVDAIAAIKRYNNVQLDGKPMKIEIVGTNIATPAAPPVPVPVPVPAASGAFGFGNGNVFPRGGFGRGGAFGRPRGGGGGVGGGSRGRRFGRGGGRGGRGGRAEKVSADDLDADLDKYHTEAMQTN